MVQASYEFRTPQVILFGPGISSRIGTEAKALGKTKTLLVTDQNMVKAGYVDQISKSLKDAGLQVTVFPEIGQEPTVDHVEEGLKVFKESGSDILVGLGGGSPLDAAKAIGVMATNPGRISDYMGANKVKFPKVPVIAVGTTAGTGSEVTRFTIITDTKTSVKMLINSPYLLPEVAVDDPLLTLSMPPRVTAATGIDALTHAIESYISKRSQQLSDLLALSAIRRIAGNLRQAYANPDDIEARTQMMLGQLEAGMSFSNSSVALVHGMARPIGAYFHVAHGLSNAMLLPHVMEYSVIGNPKRFAEIAEAMGENICGLSLLEAGRRAVKAVRELCQDLNIPTLRGAGIDEKRLLELAPQMARDAIASGSPGNNPRTVTVEEIVELYKKAL